MNKKLYVGNLPFDVEETALKEMFEADGRRLSSVKIINDRETGRSRGFGFVELESAEDAEKVIAAFNGKEVMGRALVVNEAREQQPRAPRGDFGGYGGGGGGRSAGSGGFRGKSGRSSRW